MIDERGPRHRPRRSPCSTAATSSTRSTSPASSTSTAASRPASSARPSSASTAAIPYKDRRIRIVQLGLEEDACREVSDVGHRRTYLTDRLGMPLIETVTGPDMRTPAGGRRGRPRSCAAWSAAPARCAPASAPPARTSTSASRGGTRDRDQGRAPHPAHPAPDLQRGHAPVEPAPPPRASSAAAAITPETFRVRRRGRHPDPPQHALPARSARPSTRGTCAAAVVLRGFRDLLDWPTQTDTYFSQRDLRPRPRHRLPDRRSPTSSTPTARPRRSRAPSGRRSARPLGRPADDTVVVVWGAAQDVKTGAQEIVIRAREATVGVPSETRQALRGRDQRLRAHPARPGPDVSRHRPAAEADHARSGSSASGRACPCPSGTREAWYRELGVPADRRRAAGRLAAAPALRASWSRTWEIDARRGGRGPRPVPQALEKEGPGRRAGSATRRYAAIFAPVRRPADLPRGRLRPDASRRLAARPLPDVRRLIRAGDRRRARRRGRRGVPPRSRA